MVQIIYYEGARRSRQGKPIVAGNGRGTTDIEGPQVDAKISVEIEEELGSTGKLMYKDDDQVDYHGTKEKTTEHERKNK